MGESHGVICQVRVCIYVEANDTINHVVGPYNPLFSTTFTLERKSGHEWKKKLEKSSVRSPFYGVLN